MQVNLKLNFLKIKIFYAFTIIMALEAEFNIKIPDSDIESLVTVNDYVEYLWFRLYFDKAVVI